MVGQQQQISRINGHAEPVDGATGGFDASGHNIVAINDGRCADDDDRLAAAIHQVVNCRRHSLGSVVAANFGL